jgi:hypothetical protein
MKTILTTDIEQALFKHVRETSRINFIIGELDIGYKWGIVDALQATINKNKITWRCYEIKVSKKDFYSKAKLTFVGHFNYYVMPLELYEAIKHEIPKEIGVYVYKSVINMLGTTTSYIEIIKKPKRLPLKVPTEHLASRFITSSHRDLYKLLKKLI